MANETSKSKEMSFLGHLEELRWHLFRSVVVVMALAVVLFCFPDFVFGEVIFGPKHQDFLTYRALCKISHWLGLNDVLCINAIPFDLINIQLSGQFVTHMWVSFIGGLVLGFPYLMWELWRFVKPALYDKEIKAVYGFVFYSSALFILGVLFAYYILLPLTVNFLGGYQVTGEVKNTISMGSYISAVTWLTLICGIVFELPILVYFLSRLGLLTAAFMRKYRRHAFVVILVVAAIITPTADIATQLVVSLPLFLLYEASILVAGGVEKKSSERLV